MKLMSLKKELQQANEISYNTWFNRWLNKYRLEEELHDATMQGYEAFTIFDLNNYNRSSESDKYLIRRYTDKRFVERLKQAYPSLRFTVIDEEKVKTNILGLTNKYHVYKVSVRWD